MADTKKPTKAQAAWLRAIAAGNVNRAGHSWVNGMRNRSRVCRDTPASSTYTMTLALRDAGWIDEVPEGAHGPFHERYPLVLTDAGRAAIGLPANPILSQGTAP